MALATLCDGCGKPVDAQELVERGFARKKQYCAECGESVLAYSKSVDDLHSKLALDWVTGLSKIQEDWRAEHPLGKLPDEGDA